ncbi:MAG: YfiR family protein [Salinivirgaceae bacterium]|jgi:hypothetical protein|nr:YfiR family protein [Salinivirgaceae bacterium]
MKKLLLLITIVLYSMVNFAQDATIVKYKSSFMINFIRYVGWPDEAKDGDFVIGVLKNKAIAQHLQRQTSGKKFGYQKIIIKEFKSVDEITNCQMLYVSRVINFGKNSQAISTKLENKNTLIVTERNGSTDDGAMINFVVVDNKLKFEVSSTNAEKFGLKLSNSLVSMSNAIKV